jgi:hypothetical protein
MPPDATPLIVLPDLPRVSDAVVTQITKTSRPGVLPTTPTILDVLPDTPHVLRKAAAQLRVAFAGPEPVQESAMVSVGLGPGGVGHPLAFPSLAAQPPDVRQIILPDLPRLPAQLFAHFAEITRPGVPQGLVDVLPSHMLRPDPPRGAATGPVGASPDPVAPPPARGTRVEVVLNGASGRERVSEERFADGDDDVIRTIVDLVDGALTENAVRGRGQLTAALRQMFGSRRPGL